MNSVLGGGLKYYYGGRNASHNRIGRLMMREDGTGAIEYFYGKMGEVTKTRRTLIVPNQAIATYVTQWTYDSHYRLLEMIYPDEEKVTYSYNLGGQLEKVRGEKSYGYDYITKLGYDKFEQRSYLKYCNGAETFYTYDNRRRLSNLAVNSGNTAIMDNDYTFDAVSNVLSVANNASLPASGNAGGKMSHAYTYDGLYRLVSATGTYTGADSKSASYTLAMGYDNMHRITSKSQHLTQDNVQFNGTLNVGYDLTYTYGTEAGKKFQLSSVKDVNYRTEETPGDNKIENNHVYLYDKNGNLIYVNTGRMMNDGHNETGTGERKLIWDEENRLLAVDDNGFVSNYWYDADGERTVKTSGESDQVYVNGVFSGGSTNTAKFSLYVSPYLVANQGGRYTKHIYAGSQRIVSKIGDFASYGSDPRRIEYAGANTDGLSVDYKAKYAAQQQVIKDNYKTFEVPYNGEDNDNYADGEGFCCNDGSMEAAIIRTKAQARAVAKSFKDPDNYENLQFFYHPDHLGSSSFITNLEGEVVQHIEYVPFGEVFIEERNGVWNTPYLFNAKEFDEETGMYYYGARYYEPRLSLWISTDPLGETAPHITGYCYTANNPIILIDPDGEAWKPTKNEETGQNTGYEWIEPSKSYDSNGNLLPGLYEQAIFFSNQGNNGKTFDSENRFNMGSSIATVYCADGTTAEFEACTYPSNLDKYATVPEGMYEAKVGMHNGRSAQYKALRMSDIGTTDFNSSSIELGKPNPSNSKTTKARGINIHKPGLNNLTGMTSSNSPISEGCLLINRNNWSEFMGKFEASALISVTVSRSMSSPTNQNVMKPQLSRSVSSRIAAPPITMPVDALRVVKNNPIYRPK